MRESVLLALVHIFAIVSTVNPTGITSRGKKILRLYLRRYLNRELEEEYFALFESNLEFYSNELRSVSQDDLLDDDSLITFQITNICRQIKKGLFLEERVIVFLQLLEFAYEDGKITRQEKTIIDIVSRTFNISKKEYDNASAFMVGRNYDAVTPECILLIENTTPETVIAEGFRNYEKWHHIRIKGFKGQLFILHIESTGSLILTYDGPLTLYFKSRDIISCRPYLLERGVNIKGQGIEPIYYSRIYKKFVSNKFSDKVIFEGHDVEYLFKNSDNGIQKMNFRVESGNLIGIMGGSGVGKTTLLNLLNGKLSPGNGQLFINGYDIHGGHEELNGLIGFVPQDDLLIEELTVYENLYFNARLCFSDYDEDKIKETVDKVLIDLDLYEIRDLQVGDPLNKKVSGGQRKRLNIGLELMREPVVLFIDEPTSGLSSFDSEKVMVLLKEQVLHGKLIFAIIHQPSSNILKMFDRLWILDKGGYMVYDGDPVEALVYFKTETSQANAAESECPSCGNIYTDNILNIIEVKVIDSAGYPGLERQISPKDWNERYRKKMMPALDQPPARSSLPVSNFRIPDRASQIRTFLQRALSRKLADQQFMTINLLEAPLLAFILGYLSKYSEKGIYVFSGNKNYPVFLFMAVVVALFMGLTVSAEEIFRDRKILEREKFLNLSRFSYLLSKVCFLFVMSVIQALSFLLVSNTILETRGMMLQQFIILFSTFCFGNLMGLNISAGMRTAVSIYILIPLILVPQLLLGGAMIRFDDLHKSISRKNYVPLIGDIMVTRWAYEAIVVEQFKSNRYEKPFFAADMEKSRYDWHASFLVPTLKAKIDECIVAGKKEEYRAYSRNNLGKIKIYLAELSDMSGLKPGLWINDLDYESFNERVASGARHHLDSISGYLRMKSNKVAHVKDSLYRKIISEMGEEKFLKLRETDYNENLADIALNRLSTLKIIETDKKLIQKADPVLMLPDSRYGRAHFFAPYKQIGNLKIYTLLFNLIVIWILNLILFVALYFNVLKRIIFRLESLRLPFWRQFNKEFL